jgi:hypothetical protein
MPSTNKMYIGMLERSEAPGKRIKKNKKEKRVFRPIKEFLWTFSLFNQ